MGTLGLPLAVFLGASLLEQVSRSAADNPFDGIHQLEWFDLALLIPYFALVALLGLFGLHRYVTLWRYWRYGRNLRPTPLREFEELPAVTIQLPLYNERFVVARLLEAVSEIDYPRDRLQIQVLDDSTDETHALAERLVGEYRARGVPMEYHHRKNRTGFKAGALDAGLKSATGELIAIFDADFVPPRDFLRRTVHYFTDPQVGLVQTRWGYLNRHYNVLTEVQAILLDGHFLLEHPARAATGLFFNFNGTGGIMRRAMIEDAGGWQHDTLTEDSDLSYRAQLKGWRFIYLPEVECPSELPVETYAFQVQQSRWAKGLTQVAVKLLPSILRAPIPLREKFEAVFHLAPNLSYLAMLLISVLILPVMIVRFYIGWHEMLFVDFPIIWATFVSIVAFYLVSQRERDRRSWKRAIALMPALIAAGISLTLINSRAVMEALLKIPSGFVRTAKYAIAGNRRPAIERAKYRRRSGWLPYLELACGAYFLMVVGFLISSYNFFAVPFLLLFVGGYLWAAFTTLYEEHQDRLRWQRERAVGIQPAD